MAISFSQQELNQYLTNIGASASALGEVQGQLDEFKRHFNTVDETLVQPHWDKVVNGELLSGMNDTVVKLIEQIDGDFAELKKRQEELSGELSSFIQANVDNEQKTEAAVEATEGE